MDYVTNRKIISEKNVLYAYSQGLGVTSFTLCAEMCLLLVDLLYYVPVAENTVKTSMVRFINIM